MTGFHQYASVALCSVHKNRTMYAAYIFTRNEATVHCVLLHELAHLISRNPRNPLR